MKPTSVLNFDSYAYPRLLLQEKKLELQAIELKHGSNLMSENNYLSCHRSLLQGISELEKLLLNDPNAHRT
jgi:hypothetical protein